MYDLHEQVRVRVRVKVRLRESGGSWAHERHPFLTVLHPNLALSAKPVSLI